MHKLHRTVRKLHKWAAITVGVFGLAWLISGIVMVIPITWLRNLKDLTEGSQQVQEAASGAEAATQVEAAPVPLGFSDIQISVPQAISNLEEELGQKVQVTGVTATRFGEGLAYEITLQDGSRRLVDALNGTPIAITQAMAENAARAWVQNAGAIVEIALLRSRDYYYWGSLPAYKIVFDDDRRTVAYVSAVTGQIEQTTSRLSRIHHWVESIHTFEPLRLISENDVLRKGLLILVSMVGIGVVVTGFYLTLPARRRSS